MKRLLTVLIWLTSAAELRAQAPESATDSTLRRRAESITVGEYCRVATAVLETSGVIATLASDSSDARASAAVICNPLLSDFSLWALTGRSAAPLAAVARVHTTVYPAVQLSVLDAMSEFRSDVRQPDVREVVHRVIGDSLNGTLVLVSETAQSLVTSLARDRALVRLGNYERKLGPGSARLNGPEVLLNYAAQRWIPGFRATPLGGPSPWEIVASYAPGYITFASRGATPTPVSTSEFGVRRYLFGQRFGKSGLSGLAFPSYWSAGVLTASDQNGALVWPWKGRDRSGAYVSWGAVKAGYINRDRGRWLISKQFQAVPFLF